LFSIIITVPVGLTGKENENYIFPRRQIWKFHAATACWKIHPMQYYI